MADQENRNPPADLVYEDTGAMAPVVYFDIVAAYGTMNGSDRGGTRDPHSPSQDGRHHRREIPLLGSAALQSDRRPPAPQRARCRAEDAGAAAGQCGRDLHDELTLASGCCLPRRRVRRGGKIIFFVPLCSRHLSAAPFPTKSAPCQSAKAGATCRCLTDRSGAVHPGDKIAKFKKSVEEHA